MSVLKQFEHLKIKLEAILLATNNFAEEHCIGQGGFGKVYKGELLLLKEQTTVALKRLDRTCGQGDSEFWKEVIMLSVYRHENIVSLLGFCDEKGEKILVYKYESNRSLDLHLGSKLPWVQRLMICIGAARGIAYLHDPGKTQQRVLNRDIKSSNILLDEKWNAKIADLGLSKFGPANQLFTFLVSNNAVGTIGYCDPLYFESGILTKESDVYSFGVVLFEVLCGRLCIGNNDKPQSFTQLVRKHCKQNNLDEIICVNIKDQIHATSLKMFWTIAYRCLKRDHENRPLMKEIVTKLESALTYQLSTIQDVISVHRPSRRHHRRHMFRFYSEKWRTWAACFIQAAWRRYSGKKILEQRRKEEEKLIAHHNAGGGGGGGGGTSYSLGANIFGANNILALIFAAKVVREVNRNRENWNQNRNQKIAREKMKLQKPPEPDFTSDDD